MKILQIHNEYYFKGGEDTVVNLEFNLLKKKNIVHQLIRKNLDEIKNLKDKLNVVKNITNSRISKKIINAYLDKYKPRIVHIHNIFPLWTGSLIAELSKRNIPMVMTLHNYRFFCSNGIFFRNNKICTKCINGSLFNGVKYKCYQNSYIKSLAVYSYLRSIRKNKILDKIDKFIVFTEFSKDIYSKIIDKNKIIIKPNFTTKITTNINIKKKNKFFLFVGRISSEKGIDLIINNLNRFKINIKIIGDGPLLDQLKLIKSNKIQFLGKLTKQKTIAYMKKAECLLFTSKWYEGMPMVILEAMSVGLPIVSSRLGNMKYIIKNNFNGLFFNINLKYDLSKKANYLYKNKIFKKLLKKNSINVYKKKYSSSTNYIILKNIYEQVIKEKLKY